MGNMILLKQIPQRAVINNQEEDEPEDPIQDKAVQAADLPAAHCPKENLFSINYYYNSNMTPPPGQCRRKQTDVNFVSTGRSHCHASKQHQIK